MVVALAMIIMMEHNTVTSSVIDLIKIIKGTLQHKILKVGLVYADISRQNNFPPNSIIIAVQFSGYLYTSFSYSWHPILHDYYIFSFSVTA